MTHCARNINHSLIQYDSVNEMHSIGNENCELIIVLV